VGRLGFTGQIEGLDMTRKEPKTNLQPTCNQLATDCISRQAAIDAICKACANGEDYVDCIERRPESTFCDEIVALRKLPSAQPEIIRCIDCVYYDLSEDDNEVGWCCVWDSITEGNVFCGYAERRTE